MELVALIAEEFASMVSFASVFSRCGDNSGIFPEVLENILEYSTEELEFLSEYIEFSDGTLISLEARSKRKLLRLARGTTTPRDVRVRFTRVGRRWSRFGTFLRCLSRGALLPSSLSYPTFNHSALPLHIF